MNLQEVEQKYKCKYVSKYNITHDGEITWIGNSYFIFEDGDSVVIEENMRKIPFQYIVEKYLRNKKLERILKNGNDYNK